MKKKSIMKNTYKLLFIALLFPLLSGCNNEDDIIQILVGKTWKLTYIADENEPTKMYNFWGDNNDAYKKSQETLANASTYTLVFEGSDLNGVVGGTISGYVSTTNISGKWNASKESSALTTSDVKANADADKYIGTAYITGITNATSYKGSDENNLYIHFKMGQRSYFLAFKPKQVDER